MGISLSLPKAVELKPRIAVIGVGGAGGNAVNNMITSGLDGVEFVVANTDAQALALSKADRRIQMGSAITQGLGAGMRPQIGEEAAESSLPEIIEHLAGAHMLFIAAGMGGGTGTGAAPVIAKAARDHEILTVAIVTKPFQFEGSKRMMLADEGIVQLYSCVDTLIVIPNQNLFRVATENTTMSDAFAMADKVLNSGVRGVTDLMVVPGLINLDFADVRTVMYEMGKAMMGTGEATGEGRATGAAESAISNPLLDDVSLKGAQGVLINITGGSDLTLFEVDEAATLIRKQVDPEADIIVGSALDPDLDGIIRVSVVATGIEGAEGYYVPEDADDVRIEKVDEAIKETDLTDGDNIFDPDDGPVDVEDDINVICSPVTGTQPEEASPRIFKPGKPNFQPEPSVPEKPVTPVETQTVVKRPFVFFGRRKTTPTGLRKQDHTVSSNMGDLFGGDDDELEIPSFLRRQNK